MENILTLKYHQPSPIRMLAVYLIGTGGTGGYVARDLMRCLSQASKANNFSIERTVFWDPDIVEEKNLTRQNFIQRDVGAFKADVLSERYSNAFGLPILSVCSPFNQNTLRDFKALEQEGYYDKNGWLNLIISCTDNNESRRQIYESLCQDKNNRNTYWIDSGNEKKSGQVIAGFVPEFGWTGLSMSYSDEKYPMKYQPEESKYMGSCMMPFSPIEYPSILDPEKDSKEDTSCADAAVEEPQNMFINITAAVHVLNFVRQIVYKQPMYSYGIEFNINGAVNHLRNSPEMARKAVHKFKEEWEGTRKTKIIKENKLDNAPYSIEYTFPQDVGVEQINVTLEVELPENTPDPQLIGDL